MGWELVQRYMWQLMYLPLAAPWPPPHRAVPVQTTACGAADGPASPQQTSPSSVSSADTSPANDNKTGLQLPQLITSSSGSSAATTDNTPLSGSSAASTDNTSSSGSSAASNDNTDRPLTRNGKDIDPFKKKLCVLMYSPFYHQLQPIRFTISYSYKQYHELW